jgi:hypothetical protein
MSLDTINREPSRFRVGEGCHAPLSNSQAAAQDLGGVCEGDRTGRADGVSRETSSGASGAQPAGPDGEPTETARTVGGVGVPRSSADLPDSATGGERRRGTWVKVCGKSEGPADGRTAVATLFDRIRTPPKVQKLQRILYRKATGEPGYRFYSLYGELLRHDVVETAMSAVASNAGAAGGEWGGQLRGAPPRLLGMCRLCTAYVLPYGSRSTWEYIGSTAVAPRERVGVTYGLRPCRRYVSVFMNRSAKVNSQN